MRCGRIYTNFETVPEGYKLMISLLSFLCTKILIRYNITMAKAIFIPPIINLKRQYGKCGSGFVKTKYDTTSRLCLLLGRAL